MTQERTRRYSYGLTILENKGVKAFNKWRRDWFYLRKRGRNKPDLFRANLALAQCEEIAAMNANLNEAIMSKGNFRRGKFEAASMQRVVADGACFTNAEFNHTHLYGANLAGANCDGASFSHADLRTAKLDNASCKEANFHCAELQSASLKNADLSNANFSDRVRLRDADLTSANLQGANFGNADLRFAKLTGANLKGLNLNGANLHNADLTGALWDEKTRIGEANISGARIDTALYEFYLAGLRVTIVLPEIDLEEQEEVAEDSAGEESEENKVE